MACEMGFAVFAAEDLVRVQVGVVDEAHRSHGRDRLLLCDVAFEGLE